MGYINCLTPAQQQLWDETMLPLEGIGEDLFSFENLSFVDSTSEPSVVDCSTFEPSVVDCETVYDFQRAWSSLEQKTWHSREHIPLECSEALDGKAARLWLEGRCRAAKLWTAPQYLYCRLVDASGELLRRRVPYDYTRGRYHGRIEGSFQRVDIRVRANGEEAVVEEVQRRVWRYETRRLEELIAFWNAARRGCVYIFNSAQSAVCAPYRYVFADRSACAAVRFRSFVRDCRDIKAPASELQRATAAELARLESFIDEQVAQVRALGGSIRQLPVRARARREVFHIFDQIFKE